MYFDELKCPGESKVISGLEKGMEGQCAGEKIVMVVPPEYGYGDKSADKVYNLIVKDFFL